MKAISIALLFVALAAPAVAASGDSDFLCIADMATGFKFDPTTKLWQSAQFNVSKNRYVIKITKDGLTWNDFGSTLPPLQCTPFNDSGSTSCSLGSITIVSFNRVNMRFQYVYLSGWVDSDLPPPKGLENNSALTGFWNAATAKSGNSPLVEIGRCSAL